ncbi:MAG: glycosyltransferase family 39 protein [Crocinitomicaceae bacterium]
MKKQTEQLLIATILAAGFILRILSSYFHSYSSDELSAITRLNYDNFSDILEYGVKLGDMHPAGVQIFMKLWASIFGTSEIAMRLPFVICGTISIFVIYKLGKHFSTNVALFASALWAFLLFPIIQSELARPYSPGLLFTLLTGHFLLKFILNDLTNQEKWRNSIVLAIFISAAMYTHYFAFVMVGFMACSALFFIEKSTRLPLVLSGIASVLLFLPHLSITMYQTSIEGGLQWLSPPNNIWLFKFLFHGFNSSWLLLVSLISITILAVTVRSYLKETAISKLNFILMIWFFGIYIVGAILSHYLTPVLKFPVMLFAFPFCILLISRLIEPLFSIGKSVFPIIFMTIALLSTTIEQKLFSNGVHYEVFKEISEHIRTWENKIGKNNLTIAMNISNPNYLNFYALQTGEEHIIDIDIINYGDAAILDSLLQNCRTSYFAIGYSARHTPIQFLNQCLSYFPFISDQHQYNNSAIFLLSKNIKDQNIRFKKLQTILFSDSGAEWEFESEKYDPIEQVYFADGTNSYRPQYIFPASNESATNQHFLRVEIDANITSENEVTIVAIPQKSGNETVLDNYENPIWIGKNVEQGLLKNGKESFAFSLPPNMPADGHVNIYVWNRNAKPFFIKNIEISEIKNIWNN